MNRVIKKHLTALTCCLLPWLPLQTVEAAVAQAPLYVGGQVEPNVMFTLDDSGSMQWEQIPDDDATWYVYPVKGNVYGAGGVEGEGIYPNIVVDFETTNNVYGMRVRSSDNVPEGTLEDRTKYLNRIYYDPTSHYTPWPNSDGSLMDNAVINCAYHNPHTPDLDGGGVAQPGADGVSNDCRDLTQSNTESARWSSYDGDGSDFPPLPPSEIETKSFWPAVYYRFNGNTVADSWDKVNFQKVEIRPGSTYTGGEDRDDCAAKPDCTYDEEIQNFANWYSYYRSRILISRAGAGRAFSQPLTEGFRIGFAAINKDTTEVDGGDAGTIITGVRKFTGEDRGSFFETLYGHEIAVQGTPLRQALDNVGKYFERDDYTGPWAGDPGTFDENPYLTCRQSYHILMTDGYWNGPDPETIGDTNVDNTAGPNIAWSPALLNAWPDSIVGLQQNPYSYQPENPYEDSYNKTLADVAMYYWNRDLQPDLDNRVPPTAADSRTGRQEDPAVWQHLVNFTVGLGVNGTLDPENDLPDLISGDKVWPQVEPDEMTTIDDLWHAAVNSRGVIHFAGDPGGFRDKMNTILAGLRPTTGSSTGVTANSARLNTATYVYQARFNSESWYGELRAFEINAVTSEVADNPTWEAGAELAERVHVSGIPRKIFTYVSADNDGDGLADGGVDFLWAELPESHKNLLEPECPVDEDCLGSSRVDYLRGSNSLEERFPSGVFRNRIYRPEGEINYQPFILADIVNSDPWFAGHQDFGYNLLPGTEGSSYIDFRDSDEYKDRPGVVYVGANGGMLHAFRADDSSDAGEELFAYAPESLFSELWKLTDPAYTHQYYVDGPPKVGDAYIQSATAWKSILVGATGAGGKAVFALDVTDPEGFTKTQVMWEFTTADDDGDGKDTPADNNPDGDLGFTIGEASIVRMANGEWAAVFGNGYESDRGYAVLFIVNIADGSLIRKIDTEVGTSNGLSAPIAVDVNNDRIVDRIYAGDLLGNMWAFDVSSGNSDDWDVDYESDSNPAPLFTAKSPENSIQPITARPQVGRHPQNGVLVYFGTGKYFAVGDGALTIADDGYKNTFYAIWDDFSAAGPGTVAEDRVSEDFASLLRQEITNETVTELVDVDGTPTVQARLVSSDGSSTTQNNNVEVRITSEHPISWATDKGWYMDLKSPVPTRGWEGERVVTKAQLIGDAVLFTTIIPSSDVCDAGGTGWLMELNAVDGSRLPYSPFDLNSDDYFDEDDYEPIEDAEGSQTEVVVSGKRFDSGMPNRPGIIHTSDGYIAVGTGSEGEDPQEEQGNLANPSGRQSWRQLR